MANRRICDSKQKKFLFRKYDFDIVKCLNCGLYYTDFSPNQKFAKNFYTKNYFVRGGKKKSYDDFGKEETSSRITSQKRIKLLKLGKKGSVMDVGCAYGFFLSEMPDSWNKFGIEISEFAARIAKKNNPSANIKNSDMAINNFFGHKFDLVTLWDVIEHLDNPKKAVSEVYKVLSKRGKIALTTGDVDSMIAKTQGLGWHLYNPPQHLSYFSGTTIKKLLTFVGFKNVTISHQAAYYPVSYILHKISNLYGINMPNYKTFEDWIIPLNLRDIMFVTATK